MIGHVLGMTNSRHALPSSTWTPERKKKERRKKTLEEPQNEKGKIQEFTYEQMQQEQQRTGAYGEDLLMVQFPSRGKGNNSRLPYYSMWKCIPLTHNSQNYTHPSNVVIHKGKKDILIKRDISSKICKEIIIEV